MRKTNIAASLAFGAAALVLAACALPPAPPPRQPAARSGAVGLAGSSWALESLNGQRALPEATVTLNFEADKVNGSDGCNRFMGSYTQDGASITFGQLAGTLMACPDPIMKQASDFRQALASARAARVADGRLTLLDEAGNAVATFVAQETSLADTSWKALSYNNGKQAVVSVISGSELTVAFDAVGRISGNAGCNAFTGSYKLEDGGKIAIGPLATTRKLCNAPEGVMEQEAQFIAALEQAATYRIEGDRLQLRTAEGATAANFQRVK